VLVNNTIFTNFNANSTPVSGDHYLQMDYMYRETFAGWNYL